MNAKRKVEVFSAGCAICEEVIQNIRDIACPSCEIIVLDMQEKDVADRAKTLGIRSIPAVFVDGVPAPCCEGRGVDLDVLRKAGIGRPVTGE